VSTFHFPDRRKPRAFGLRVPNLVHWIGQVRVREAVRRAKAAGQLYRGNVGVRAIPQPKNLRLARAVAKQKELGEFDTSSHRRLSRLSGRESDTEGLKLGRRVSTRSDAIRYTLNP